MKQTGVVRRIDNLGRIVIPKEIRKTLHIHDGELLELMINKDEIILNIIFYALGVITPYILEFIKSAINYK